LTLHAPFAASRRRDSPKFVLRLPSRLAQSSESPATHAPARPSRHFSAASLLLNLRETKLDLHQPSYSAEGPGTLQEAIQGSGTGRTQVSTTSASRTWSWRNSIASCSFGIWPD